MARRKRKTPGRGRRQRSKREPELVSGTITISPDGSGRLIADGLDRPAIYLPPEEAHGLRSGDRLTVRLEVGRKGRVRGRLVSRGRRASGRAVGIVRKNARGIYLEPDPPGPPILIDATTLGAAKNGDAVAIEVSAEARGGRPAQGRIVEVLGRPDHPKVQVEMLVRAQGLALEFAADVLAEAEAYAAPTAEADEREDLRSIPHVTIDGADARDFDDAVAVRAEGDGFRLWVSIADVSHYVKPGSALDRSAAERGTSVYFPHRAVSMLPERLSNDLCSLRPNVLRFAMTCEMRVRPDGRRQGIRIYPSLIKSHGRLTYEQVQAALDGKAPSALSEHVRHLEQLLDVARLLRARRMERGAIDLDVTEAQVLLAPDGTARDIKPRQRLEAHRLIEDLMIAANESVAEQMLARGWPAVFRVHPQPDPKRIAGLAMWAQRAGLDFDFDGSASVEVLARFAESLRRGSRGVAGQMMLLRSLAQARYRDENVGHYALASKAYVHFTSPIRRYPDLLVHRSLRAMWSRGSRPRGLGEAAERASLQERRATEAERAVDQLMACQVAAQNLGRTMSGTVVGVHRAGAFVRGVELYVEGLLATEDLEAATSDSWDYLEDEQALLARRTGRRLRLGDAVKVRLASVNLKRRYINFELIELPRDDAQRPAKARRRSAVDRKLEKKRRTGRETGKRSPRRGR